MREINKSRIRKPKKQVSLKEISVRVMALALFLFFLMIGASYRNIRNAEKMAYQYISDTAQLYMDVINSDLEKIVSEIYQIYKNDSKVGQIPEVPRPDTTKYYSLYKAITMQHQNLRLRYGSQYQFFVYSMDAEFLILDVSIFFKQGYQTELSRELRKSLSDPMNAGWNFIEVDEHNYMYSGYVRDDKVIGCLVDVDALMQRFELNNMGYETIPHIVLKDNSIIANADYRENYDILKLVEKSKKNSILRLNNMCYKFPMKNVGYIQLLIVSTQGVLQDIFQQQTILILLAVGFVLGGILVGYYYFRKILEPMKQFVHNLKNPNEEQFIHNSDSHNLLELEIASKEFRNLLKEIKTLKIEVYEKELLQQHTQLEYLQEQIKPHFYLNCLSIISGMAEEKNAGDIVEIVDVLSKYMRYVIQDSFQLRRVCEEVSHIENYIRIQKLRYGDAFTFEASVQDEVKSCCLPALLLQGFVENAIKHAVSLDKVVEVSLYITTEETEEEKYLYISVSDTGKGFPKEILEAIANGEEIFYDGRKHIGIENAIQRLKILYGDNAKITLSNMDESFGAVVEVIVPFIEQRGEEEQCEHFNCG